MQGISRRQRQGRDPQLLSRGAALTARPLLAPMALQQQAIALDLIPQSLALHLQLAATGGSTPELQRAHRCRKKQHSRHQRLQHGQPPSASKPVPRS